MEELDHSVLKMHARPFALLHTPSIAFLLACGAAEV